MSIFSKLKASLSLQDNGDGANKEVKAKVKEKADKVTAAKKTSEKDRWFETEGKISIDMFKQDGELIIQSTIAGITPDNLEITIQGDLITLKGVRPKPEIPTASQEPATYFYQEAYWGPFSRQIILPEEVDPSRSEATLREGILTIRVPLLEKEKKRTITVKE